MEKLQREHFVKDELGKRYLFIFDENPYTMLNNFIIYTIDGEKDKNNILNKLNDLFNYFPEDTGCNYSWYEIASKKINDIMTLNKKQSNNNSVQFFICKNMIDTFIPADRLAGYTRCRLKAAELAMVLQVISSQLLKQKKDRGLTYWYGPRNYFLSENNYESSFRFRYKKKTGRQLDKNKYHYILQLLSEYELITIEKNKSKWSNKMPTNRFRFGKNNIYLKRSENYDNKTNRSIDSKK